MVDDFDFMQDSKFEVKDPPELQTEIRPLKRSLNVMEQDTIVSEDSEQPVMPENQNKKRKIVHSELLFGYLCLGNLEKRSLCVSDALCVMIASLPSSKIVSLEIMSTLAPELLSKYKIQNV